MSRYILVAVIGLTWAVASPAIAQAQPDKGPPVKKLEAEIEKLRNQIQELQERLEKAQARAPERRPGGGAEGEKKKKDGQGAMGFGGSGGKGPGGKGPGGFGPGGFGRGGFGPGFGGFGGKKKGAEGADRDGAKMREDWAKKKKDFGGSPWGKKKGGKDADGKDKRATGKDSPWRKMPDRSAGAEWAKKKSAFDAPKSGRGSRFGGDPSWAGSFGRGWSSRDGEIERRLERIQDEIEQLRRELRRR
jgi:hypothetical protein